MSHSTLHKSVSLGLATVMMLITLGAIDQLALQEPQAQQMAAKAEPAAKAASRT